MAANKKPKTHIFLGKNGKAAKYTHPGSGGSKPPIPAQERTTHGLSIRTQLAKMAQAEAQLIQQAAKMG